ncbi:hypothetical protein CC78DRAFT_536735 [Lojkania enalia]|uniref:Uncharacterized protein n=1 Tax=Lojkania enalia TaxID=147567 RepID=A0A9P4K2X2_9PLEO|nr:hypothetical protein CC78DRAFT_536735 [Didymosphaeria enalia]
MPLRTRLRRAFTRGSQDDESFSRTSKGSKSTGKRDSIHYQPGEKMPPLKYRRPVNPEHKAHLEAFSWAKAWRRKSDQSVYSPMGSRMPSRKNSYTTVGRKSIGGRSMRRASSKDVGVDSGIGGSVIDDEEVEERKANQLREGSDEEGDVTNGMLFASTPRCVPAF